MGKSYRHRHQFRRFVTGVTKHQALVAGTLLGEHALAFCDPLGDIRRLAINRGQNGTGLIVETHRRVIIADLLDGLADDIRHIDIRTGGDFTGNHCHAGRDESFTSHPGYGVLGDYSIEDRVGNLVRNLVRVALGNGFGSKQKVCHCHDFFS